MAKVKFPPIIKSFDELPEPLRPVAESLYDKDGDEYVFQGFDESEAKKKTDEFRTRNRTYHNRIQELEGQLAKVKDIDPAKYQEGLSALEEMRKLQDQELIKKGDVEGLVKSRLGEAEQNFTKGIKAKDEVIQALTGERDTYKRELDALVIDSLVTRVATKVGKPLKGALPHIQTYGRSVWKLNKEGKAQAFKHSGEPWYGKNGDPITEDEWGSKLLEEIPFMFESGKGGDSKGGSGEDGVTREGNVKYIDRNDPRAMGKFAKEIAAGTVVPR